MTGGPDQATTAHLGMDLLAQGAPAVVRAAHSGVLGELDRTVESGPGHHLRVGEVALGVADFPDSLVRLAPSLICSSSGHGQRLSVASPATPLPHAGIRSLRALVLRLQDRHVWPVGAPVGERCRHGGEQPAAMLVRAQHGGKKAAESNRGAHSQSMEPSRLTSAAVRVSPNSA
jgi:hypothetical protein